MKIDIKELELLIWQNLLKGLEDKVIRIKGEKVSREHRRIAVKLMQGKSKFFISITPKKIEVYRGNRRFFSFKKGRYHWLARDGVEAKFVELVKNSIELWKRGGERVADCDNRGNGMLLTFTLK